MASAIIYGNVPLKYKKILSDWRIKNEQRHSFTASKIEKGGFEDHFQQTGRGGASSDW